MIKLPASFFCKKLFSIFLNQLSSCDIIHNFCCSSSHFVATEIIPYSASSNLFGVANSGINRKGMVGNVGEILAGVAL